MEEEWREEGREGGGKGRETKVVLLLPGILFRGLLHPSGLN